MSRYLWDLETNGLLDEVSTIHIMALQDLDTGETHVFNQQPDGRSIAEGLALLQQAELLVGHNSIAYDTQVIKKLTGIELPWHRQRDTLVLARLIWSDMKGIDLKRRKKASGKDFPPQLIGRHSLEAWGHRLGNHKGDYKGGWSLWSQEMQDYCLQDLEVTRSLWDLIVSKNYSEEAVVLETQVAYIIDRQERHGFQFDAVAAPKLYARLVQRKLELEAEVKAVFKPRFRSDGEFTPKRDVKSRGYTADAPLTKLKLVEFNPGSREHVAEWLTAYYGWQPAEFTPDGRPKVDDAVIAKLDYPEAKPLKEYFMVDKRIGQLAEGKEAWLKKVGKDGRMHGRINTNGAVTGRMTHSGPNMGQVPAGYSPYGHECRSLFIAPKGKVLVGADADALELRDLAGYMAKYDDGAYVRTVLDGKKEDGTDMHSVNCRALGMEPMGKPFGDKETGRDIAKTFFYAFIYGAGDEKLGAILTRKQGKAAVGKQARAAFLNNLPALGRLVDQVKKTASERGFLFGLDRRELAVRSAHGAINTLLQSAGAIQMKKALCLLDDSLQETGLIPGEHYEFVANVHDEWQIEVDDGLQETVGRLAVESIRRAGEHYAFRCPLGGEWKSGRTWADTH